jgi:DeoR/GlpR family transcriptional regulator of sugar metabolism
MKITEQRAIAEERRQRVKLFTDGLKSRGASMNLNDIGRIFGVTGEQIRQDLKKLAEAQQATP